MPKPYTFPNLFEEVIQLSLKEIKEWGNFNRKSVRWGTMHWSSNGSRYASISIKLDNKCDEPYLELDYIYKCKPRLYKVQLVSIASNLGKGRIWYFLCPKSGLRCRKLYLNGGFFINRKALVGYMYNCQIYSKKDRSLLKHLTPYMKSDDYYAELHKKHFKRSYAGKPTKRYLRLQKLIQQAKRVSYDDYIAAMLS